MLSEPGEVEVNKGSFLYPIRYLQLVPTNKGKISYLHWSFTGHWVYELYFRLGQYLGLLVQKKQNNETNRQLYFYIFVCLFVSVCFVFIFLSFLFYWLDFKLGKLLCFLMFMFVCLLEREKIHKIGRVVICGRQEKHDQIYCMKILNKMFLTCHL